MWGRSHDHGHDDHCHGGHRAHGHGGRERSREETRGDERRREETRGVSSWRALPAASI
jgi:hypothetical protein